MTKLNKFILTVTLQVIAIISIIIFKLLILGNGTEVLLQIKPIDPTSPLRGDYLTFQYDISSIDSYYFQGNLPMNGDIVFVTLIQNGKYWTVNSAALKKPLNGVFIKGRVVSGGREVGIIKNPNLIPSYRQIQVTYGAEQYFVPEGTGRNFGFANRNIEASVTLSDDGTPVLKKVYIDGNVWP